MKSDITKLQSVSSPLEISDQDRTILKMITLISLVIALFTTTFSQNEDMGFFLSVSAFVSKGYKLYSETFEIKDPLFFYFNAASFKIFGAVGPYLFDFLITTLVGPISYLIARKLTESPLRAFIATLVFQSSITGQFGQTLRTQILATLFILLTIYFALDNRWLLSGVFLSGVLFSKMPLSVVAGGTLLIILSRTRMLTNFYRCFLGFLAFTLPFVVLMLIRGEFFPYLSMVGENFAYASGYQEIVGQKPGIAGHLMVWNDSKPLLTIFVFSNLFLIVNSYKSKKLSSLLFQLTLGLNLTVGIFLTLTAMWPHHLQISSLYFFVNTLYLLEVIPEKIDQMSPGKRLTKKKNLQEMSFQRTIVPILLIGAIVTNSGASVPIRPEMRFSNWLDPQWVKPPEIQKLEAVSSSDPTLRTFARLGSNDDNGFGAFLPAKWQMVCKRHGITGGEPLVAITRFLSCLQSQPDIILIAPAYVSQSQRSGVYQIYFRETQKILKSKFRCEFEIERSDFQVCVRI